MQQTPTAAAGQPAHAPGAAAPTPIQQAITAATLAVLRGEAHLLDLMVQAAHGALFAQPVPAPVAAADTDIGKRFDAWQKNLHFTSGDAQPLKLAAADQRFVVQHPSRGMRLCRDCIHFTQDECCDHPSQPVDITTGQAAISAAVCRRKGNPTPGGDCGPDGVLFMAGHHA